MKGLNFCQVLYFTIQFDIVTMWFGPENSTPTFI